MRTCVELRVERRGARSVVARMRGAAPLAIRELAGPGPAADVALVQTAAMLVGDDDVQVRVRVGPGAHLVLRDTSATLAQAGADARLDLDLEVDEAGHADVREQPLVVCAGARVARVASMRIGPGGSVTHREAFVLGRHGEPPGALRSLLRVERESLPVLVDTLDATDPATCASAAVLGGARVVAGLGAYGVTWPDRPADAFALGPRDTLVRRVGTSAAIAGLARLDPRVAPVEQAAAA